MVSVSQPGGKELELVAEGPGAATENVSEDATADDGMAVEVGNMFGVVAVVEGVTEGSALQIWPGVMPTGDSKTDNKNIYRSASPRAVSRRTSASTIGSTEPMRSPPATVAAPPASITRALFAQRLCSKGARGAPKPLENRSFTPSKGLLEP